MLLTTLLTPLFRLPRWQKRAVQLAVDSLLITVSFLLAMLLRLDGGAFIHDPLVWAVLPAMIPVSLLIFMRLGFYRAVIRYMSLKAVKTVLAGVVASTFALIVVNAIYQLPVPRSVPFIYAMLATLTIGGVRMALRSLYLRNQLRYKTRVLVYGAGAAGRELLQSLRYGQEYEPVGFVDDAAHLEGIFIQGVKVYPAEQTERLVADYGIEKILLAIPSATRARRREILAHLEPLDVPVQTIPGMADVVAGRVQINDLRDVAVEDLLGRDPVPPEPELMGANITGKVVMVTGAGGSIGSELCRQILRQGPAQLLLLELSEYSLYRIEQDLQQIAREEAIECPVRALLGSVQQRNRVQKILTTFGVQTIYHAAAYKHVPMVEHNMVEGLRNNVMGTLETAKAAVEAGVESFVLVSTDKAVRPTNVMGASKRLAELVCQAMARAQGDTRFCMVRFGNVLGSSGSVVPLFRRQIAAGGPITVTHPEITRYFMTIPEAAQLVIQAGAMARGGDVFVLDMGEPVNIAQLAGHLIRLSGLEPSYPSGDGDEQGSGDIAIQYTGLRPGEKLYEELLIGENVSQTRHSRIMTASEISLSRDEMEELLETLFDACLAFDAPRIRKLLMQAPLDYRPQSELADLVWEQQALHEAEAPTPSPPHDQKVVELRPRQATNVS